MRIPVFAAVAAAALSAACAQRRASPSVSAAAPQAYAEPVASAVEPTVGVFTNGAALSPVPALSLEKAAGPIEPAACALYADDGRGDHADEDAKSLACLVDWMRQTQDYLAQGGRPTRYTNAATFARSRREALRLQSRVAKFALSAKFTAVAEAPTVAAAAEPAAPEDSSQDYLNGMVDFQRGDYARARKDWAQALRLDPANADAQAGLAKLDQLEGR